MPNVSPNTVKRWHTQLKTRFDNAHSYWTTWDALVHRGIAPVTDPKLGDIALGADYRSPDLEDEEQRYIDFLSQSVFEIECTPGVDSPTGREEAKNATLFFNRLLADMNRNRRLTRMWANGQTRHGVKCWRLLTRNVKPPKDVKGEAIEEWMQKRSDVFYTRNIDNYSMRWDPITNEVNRVTWQYDLSVYEASEDMRMDGADLKGDGYESGKYYVPIHDRATASGVRWVGEEEDTEHNTEESSADRKLKVTVCEYLDSSQQCPVCDDPHPLWVGQEIIHGADNDMKDGEIVYTYTLPHKRYGSLRFVEGRVAELDNDVLHHFRPLIHKLLVEASTYNWVTGEMQGLANYEAAMPAYVRVNNTVPQEIVQAVETMMTGATVPVDDKPKDQGTALIPGQVLAWPTAITEGLQKIADDALLRFERAKIPGILFGEGLDEAVKGGATVPALILRQARIPFDTPLAQMAQAIVDMMEDIKHAILYWGGMAEEGIEEQRIYVSLAGEEGEAEAGETIYLSASKLKTNPRISVKTNPETLAEQQQREENAWLKLQRGAFDFEQYLSELGIKDTARQMNRLGLQGDRELIAPMTQQAKLHAARTMAVTLFDMDDPFLFDQTGIEQGVPQQGQGPPGADFGGNSAPAAITRAAMNGATQAPNGGGV